MPVLKVSHVQGIHQQVVGAEVVVGIIVVALSTLIHCQAKHGSADGAPLCLSEGDGGEVVGQDVGAGHDWFPLVSP